MCSVQPILRRSNTFPFLYSPVWYAAHTATPARARTGGKPFGWRAIARRYSLGATAWRPGQKLSRATEGTFGCGCMVEYGKKQSFRTIVPAGHQPSGQLFPETGSATPASACTVSSHIHKGPATDTNNFYRSDVSR